MLAELHQTIVSFSITLDIVAITDRLQPSALLTISLHPPLHPIPPLSWPSGSISLLYNRHRQQPLSGTYRRHREHPPVYSLGQEKFQIFLLQSFQTRSRPSRFFTTTVKFHRNPIFKEFFSVDSI
ncbi:hypothetical protein L1887_40796 [Cichorium endivia]|nr:hypothetical protein L1887_40796 [Cichorium endivia]